MDKHLDSQPNDFDNEKLKSFKKDLFHFFNQQINDKKQHEQIKMLWKLLVAELRSESMWKVFVLHLKNVWHT